MPIITFDETGNAPNQSVNMCTVRIRVLFFGVIRDVVGLREDTLDIAEGGNLGSVFEHYAGRFPRLRDMAASTVLALNQQFSSPSAPLAEGDEVALPTEKAIKNGSKVEPMVQ